MPNFDAVLLDIAGVPYRHTHDAQTMSKRVFERSSESFFGTTNDFWQESCKPLHYDNPVDSHGTGSMRVATRNAQPTTKGQMLNDSGTVPDGTRSIGNSLKDDVAGVEGVGLVASLLGRETTIGGNEPTYGPESLSDVSTFGVDHE